MPGNPRMQRRGAPVPPSRERDVGGTERLDTADFNGRANLQAGEMEQRAGTPFFEKPAAILKFLGN